MSSCFTFQLSLGILLKLYTYIIGLYKPRNYTCGWFIHYYIKYLHIYIFYMAYCSIWYKPCCLLPYHSFFWGNLGQQMGTIIVVNAARGRISPAATTKATGPQSLRAASAGACSHGISLCGRLDVLAVAEVFLLGAQQDESPQFHAILGKPEELI